MLFIATKILARGYLFSIREIAKGIFLGLWVILSFRKVKVKVTQFCPTLCDPMDYIFHGILQARILEWVAFPFSRGSSQPRDQTQVSCIAGEFFTSGATWETHAAAAKSLQSCLTLCDPIDGSPPGSAVPGILQARTLEWVAISFFSA